MLIRVPNFMLKKEKGEWFTSSGVGIGYQYVFESVKCSVKEDVKTDVMLFNKSLITIFIGETRSCGVMKEEDLSSDPEVNNKLCSSKTFK